MVSYFYTFPWSADMIQMMDWKKKKKNVLSKDLVLTQEGTKCWKLLSVYEFEIV